MRAFVISGESSRMGAVGAVCAKGNTTLVRLSPARSLVVDKHMKVGGKCMAQLAVPSNNHPSDALAKSAFEHLLLLSHALPCARCFLDLAFPWAIREVLGKKMEGTKCISSGQRAG